MWRGGGIATVAHDVDELSVREGPRQERDEEDVRGRLLAEAQVAVTLHAHEPAVDEPEEPARTAIAPQLLVDVAAAGLGGRGLVVVGDLRDSPDAVAQEGRARARRADDEDGSLQPRPQRSQQSARGHGTPALQLQVVAPLRPIRLLGQAPHVEEADWQRLRVGIRRQARVGAARRERGSIWGVVLGRRRARRGLLVGCRDLGRQGAAASIVGSSLTLVLVSSLGCRGVGRMIAAPVHNRRHVRRHHGRRRGHPALAPEP